MLPFKVDSRQALVVKPPARTRKRSWKPTIRCESSTKLAGRITPCLRHLVKGISTRLNRLFAANTVRSHMRIYKSGIKCLVLFSRFACRRVVNPFKRARSCPVLIHIGVDVQVDKKKHRGWHRSKNFEKISPPR